jgi:phosphohistidine phosphatase SixA
MSAKRLVRRGEGSNTGAARPLVEWQWTLSRHPADRTDMNGEPRMTAFTIAGLILGALLAMLGTMPVSAADTVYVIRHLQKESGADPALTAEGRAGATALAEVLADKGIKAIYATETPRAMETAAPLAERLELAVTPYDPSDPPALVKAAAAIKGSILVVGHSNTVPELVASFGAAEPAAIADDEYGTLYIVHAGSNRVEQVRVGAHAH